MPGEVETVTLQEAARRLGVSQQTIRRRLQTGELGGVKVPARNGAGTRWMVNLTGEQLEGAESAPSAFGGTPAADGQLVSELRARISSLEGHLAEAERASSELRQLLARADARVEALTEGSRGLLSGPTSEPTPYQHEGQQAEGKPRRRWWGLFGG